MAKHTHAKISSLSILILIVLPAILSILASLGPTILKNLFDPRATCDHPICNVIADLLAVLIIRFD
jgi:hypothetical protein